MATRVMSVVDDAERAAIYRWSAQYVAGKKKDEIGTLRYILLNPAHESVARTDLAVVVAAICNLQLQKGDNFEDAKVAESISLRLIRSGQLAGTDLRQVQFIQDELAPPLPGGFRDFATDLRSLWRAKRTLRQIRKDPERFEREMRDAIERSHNTPPPDG